MNGRSLRTPATATAALLVPLAFLDRRMQATGGPGIIPFELAGPDRSEEILQAWGPEGQRAAGISLVLDFPFLVAYTLFNVRLTERAGARPSAGARTRGAVPRALVVVHAAAGACDAIENAALLGVVVRGGDARLASLARSAARLKFAALVGGWLGIVALMLGRATGQLLQAEVASRP